MNKVKKGLVIFVLAVILLLGVRALFINWLREKTVSGVHSDPAPIEKRFPDFPDTLELYWVSSVEKRSIGPAKTELFIYAILDEEEFAHFIEGAAYSEVSRLPLFFQPKQIQGPFNWQVISEEGNGAQLLSEYQRTIYVDLNRCLVFIEANVTTN